MASLPGLTALLLARIPSEAKGDTVRSFIESVEPRDSEALDLASVKLGLELLRACPNSAGLETLISLVVGEIEKGDVESKRLRDIAALCSEYESLGHQVLQRVEGDLVKTSKLLRSSDLGYHIPTTAFLDSYYFTATASIIAENPSADGISHQVLTTTRYINFLKTLLWHTDKTRVEISSTVFTSLLALLGADIELANASGDALAAFMPLLEGGSLAFSEHERKCLVAQIWERIGDLLSDHSPAEYSSSAYRLWFRWIYEAGGYGPSQDFLQQPLYWSLIQTGLLHGYSEQRKLSLGILLRSIAISEHDIVNDRMALKLQDRGTYETQYTKYCTLVETIVLDRYPNQVSACLGDLAKLMPPHSLIHLSWMTTLLSAALSTKIQDGIRKIIGLWYIDFVTQSQEPLGLQQPLLFQGILPWATQGFLFTQSLVSSREMTECLHGQNLCDLIRRFAENCPNTSERREFLKRTLEYSSRDGSAFPYAKLYMLEGLLEGFRRTNSLHTMQADDLSLIVKTSVQAGLPEIARDLCTTYCFLLTVEAPEDVRASVLGLDRLEGRWRKLVDKPATNPGKFLIAPAMTAGSTKSNTADSHDLQKGAAIIRSYWEGLKAGNYAMLKGDGLPQVIDTLVLALDTKKSDIIPPSLLYEVLEELWDEIDTQEYPKAALMRIPSLAFHPSCIKSYIGEVKSSPGSQSIRALTRSISRILESVQQLSESRSYLLPPLVQSLRYACLLYPDILTVLPVEDFLVSFANHPPSPRPDFLFESAAASKLAAEFPHRSCALYYGAREWFAYACVMDLVNRLPNLDSAVAQSVLDQLLKPWETQKTPVPIVSKWKTLTQLQMMLILSETCITKADSTEISRYLAAFSAILAVEPWPRHRYLLEWMLARLYLHSPTDRDALLDHLATQEESNPKLTASLMKMAVMVACFPDTPCAFSLRLATLLVPLCASGKIQIRHEAHWTFPSVWDHIEARGWTEILVNPAFRALNEHIRGLERFQTPTSAYNSRSLKLDLVGNHTLANLFQGAYLRTEPVEKEMVMVEDFEKLWAQDEAAGLFLKERPKAAALIPLGTALPHTSTTILRPSAPPQPSPLQPDPPTANPSAPLQTKSTSWQTALIPAHSSPRHPLILIASLISSPANLGGLSRIAEIFGCASLALPSLSVLSTPAFTALSVTSHLHLPIFPLPPSELVAYLREKKKEGYEVVCVEQTDRSLILGGEGVRLPRKSVVVLGGEKGGCPGEILAEADVCVEIRQVGVTRSLNVQTAGAVVLYEYGRLWEGYVDG